MIAVNRLMGAVVAYGALELVSRLIQAAAIFLLAAKFSKAEFGTFYSYLAVYQFVTVAGSGGLVESLMQRFAAGSQGGIAAAAPLQLGGYLQKYMIRSGLLAVPLALIAYVVLLRGAMHRDYLVFVAIVLSGLVYGFITLISGYLTCSGANRASLTLRSLFIALSYGAAIAVSVAMHSALAFFFGMAAAGLAMLIVVFFTGFLLPHGWWRRDTASSDDASSLWFVVPAVLNWFFWYGLVIFVAGYFGTVQAAELAFVNNIASMLLLVNAAISQAWVSRYLHLLGQSRQRAESVNAQVYRIQSIVMLGIGLAVIISYEILSRGHWAFLQKYRGLGLPLVIVLFAVSISSTYFSAVNAYAVNNQGKQLAWISAVAYACSVTLLMCAAAFLGMVGVYVGLAALIASRGFAVTYFSIKRLGSGMFDMRLVLANLLLFGPVALWCHYWV